MRDCNSMLNFGHQIPAPMLVRELRAVLLNFERSSFFQWKVSWSKVALAALMRRRDRATGCKTKR